MSGRGWEFMKQLIEGLGGVDQVGGELACLGDVELCAIADPDRHGGVDGAVGVPAGKACPCRPAWEGSPQRGARGRRWARYRLAKLKANPICQWVEKDGTGCRMLATTVDHITPLAEDGDQWDWSNLQSLCREHAIQKDTQDALRGKTRARGEKG